MGPTPSRQNSRYTCSPTSQVTHSHLLLPLSLMQKRTRRRQTTLRLSFSTSSSFQQHQTTQRFQTHRPSAEISKTPLLLYIYLTNPPPLLLLCFHPPISSKNPKTLKKKQKWRSHLLPSPISSQNPSSPPPPPNPDLSPPPAPPSPAIPGRSPSGIPSPSLLRPWRRRRRGAS